MSELSKNYSKTVKSISGSWVISLSFLSLVFIYIVSYYIETGFFGGDGAFSILIGVLGWIICSIFICAFSYFSNKKKKKYLQNKIFSKYEGVLYLSAFNNILVYSVNKEEDDLYKAYLVIDSNGNISSENKVITLTKEEFFKFRKINRSDEIEVRF